MLYKSNSVAGEMQSYNRAVGISIENPLDGVPSLAITEDKVTTLPDGRVLVDRVGRLTTDFKDPTKVVPWVNLRTGEVVGSFTYEDYVNFSGSVYLALAMQRDYDLANPKVVENENPALGV